MKSGKLGVMAVVMTVMMTEEEFKKCMADTDTALREREELKKTRGWRNKVDPLSLEYADYRKTRLWKEIKYRVLLRDENKCRRCGGNADVVHHISYDDDVMLGMNDDKLVSLCDGCHTIVHFTSSGAGRTDEDKIAALTDITFNEAQPKVDMRRDPFRLPNWKRLTAVQKRTYMDEYHARKMKRFRQKPK